MTPLWNGTYFNPLKKNIKKHTHTTPTTKRYIKQYFHKMERHAHRMSQILTSGEQSTFMYGSHKPASAFNMHEITADTAFAIAADCLFGCSDDMIAQYSRKVRTLTDGDAS